MKIVNNAFLKPMAAPRRLARVAGDRSLVGVMLLAILGSLLTEGVYGLAQLVSIQMPLQRELGAW